MLLARVAAQGARCGAASPQRRAEKPPSLSHVGQKTDRSTQTPASHIHHRCCELRALRGAAEEGGDEEEEGGLRDVDRRARRDADINASKDRSA